MRLTLRVIYFWALSENIASRSELFRTIEAKHRIFQRRPALLHSSVSFPLPDPGQVTRLPVVIGLPVSGVPKEQNVTRSIKVTSGRVHPGQRGD